MMACMDTFASREVVYAPELLSLIHILIAAVIDDGLSNTVMDAARLAGCRGGTLVKARETGGAASRTLFGLTIDVYKRQW